MNDLTLLEKTRLAACESVIQKSISSFYEMGSALKEIRDGKLYKDKFETFEEYCTTTWEVGRSYVNKMISGSEVVNNLGTIVPIPPQTESQVRPLTKLEPDQQLEAWNELMKQAEETKEPITAKKVEEVVHKYCAPCVNPAIEFRRVFYLTPYYDKKLEDLMRGEKDSTYLRNVIEKHCDEADKKRAV
jgi:hypothetical protein